METIKGNWCVYCRDVNDTEFKKVLELLNKGVSPSKKWLGREKFYYGVYKGKRIRGVEDNKIIKKIPHITIEQVLCAKDDFPKEFCIKVTDKNRSEIRKIANKSGINKNARFEFNLADDMYYFWINGQFHDNNFHNRNVPIITFDQFKAHFDKQNVIKPENNKCSIRLPENIKTPKENKELDVICETLEKMSNEIKKIQNKVFKLETNEKSNEQLDVSKFLNWTIKNERFLGYSFSEKAYIYEVFMEFQKTLNNNSNNKR